MAKQVLSKSSNRDRGASPLHSQTIRHMGPYVPRWFNQNLHSFASEKSDKYLGIEHPKTTINEEDCLKFAGKVSIFAFSIDLDGNNFLYRSYELNKGKGAEYMDNTRKALEQKMIDFCKSNKPVFIEDFQEKYHMACSNECQEQSSIFKDHLLSGKNFKTNADSICLSICNRTYDKFDFFVDGINLGKNISKKRQHDCSKGVSDSRQNKGDPKNVVARKFMSLQA